MGVKITGIAYQKFPQSGQEQAVVFVLRGIEDVTHEKFVQKGMGFNTDVPRTKQALKMNKDYALDIINNRALIESAEYELEFSHNPDDPLEVIVSKLIPVEPDVNKKFLSAMGNKQT